MAAPQPLTTNEETEKARLMAKEAEYQASVAEAQRVADLAVYTPLVSDVGSTAWNRIKAKLEQLELDTQPVDEANADLGLRSPLLAAIIGMNQLEVVFNARVAALAPPVS